MNLSPVQYKTEPLHLRWGKMRTILLVLASALACVCSQSYRGQVVFLGDSITNFWAQNGWQQWAQFYEPVGAVNTGVPGDLTTNTIQRITEMGIIDGLNSKLAVLMIGTNDLAWGGLTEAQSSGNTGTIISLIREKLPGCKILLLGVFPRMEADIHEKIRNLNALNQFAFGGAPDVWFLNLESSFASGLGQIYPNLFSDGVHLSTEGYTAWANDMNPLFFELLEQDPGPTSGTTTTTTNAPPQGGIVFIGDSITDFWRTEGSGTWEVHYAPLQAANTGVSGDRTFQTIQRIEDGSLDGLNAKVAVLLIGTNDLSWGHPDDEIVTNVGTILQLIRSKAPGVHILLLGILPRAPAETHERARVVNRRLAEFASTDVTFLDMNDKFSHGSGYVYPELYTDDYLHLGPAGYVMWAVTMNPILFDLLQEGPRSGPSKQ